jgi:hypothetical protein
MCLLPLDALRDELSGVCEEEQLELEIEAAGG